MDPGQQLLSLVEARVAKGEDRHVAKARVFAGNPDLVADWHVGAGPQRETALDAYPGVQLSTHDDPGQALLALVNGYVGLGMARSTAVSRAMREHPAVTAAYDAGRLIPKPPPRPRLPASSGLRRLQSSDERLRPGETMVHRLCSGPDGGFFAIMGA